MIKKNIRLSLLLVFSGYLLYAQDVKDKSTTEQIWLDYNPDFSLSEKVDLYGDIGARTVFPNEWYRFVVGPSVRYRQAITKDIKTTIDFGENIRNLDQENIRGISTIILSFGFIPNTYSSQGKWFYNYYMGEDSLITLLNIEKPYILRQELIFPY